MPTANDTMPRKTGTYRAIRDDKGSYLAFIPRSLPPRDPPLEMSGTRDRRLLRHAERALARLELASSVMPSIQTFVYSFIRKEAVISSQIEGTQATLPDLFTATAEAGSAEKGADIEEINNYLNAIEFCRKELQRDGGLPISTRLLCRARSLPHARATRVATKHQERCAAVRTGLGVADHKPPDMCPHHRNSCLL